MAGDLQVERGVVGVPDDKTGEAVKLVIVKKDQIFSRVLLEMTADSITATLGNIGHAFAAVNPIPTVDRENRTVAINLQVVPGPRVNVRRIVFKGNTRTADEVLRREMRQFEGAWYSQAAIDRSKIRLQRLGFFEDINIETPEVAGSPDQVDVHVSITERTSGSFIFGLGYSQLSGLITSVSVVQNNFFGSGNRIGFTVQNNRFVKRMDFSYFDPYFTDDGVSVGYNLIYRELDQGQANIAAYTTNNGALQAVFGIPLTETDSIALTFGVDSNEIRTIPGRWWNTLMYKAEPMANFTVAEEITEVPQVNFDPDPEPVEPVPAAPPVGPPTSGRSPPPGTSAPGTEPGPSTPGTG